MGGEMIQQALFEEGRADEVEAVLAHAHDGGFQLDPSGAVEHMGQRDRPDFLRHPVGGQPVQQRIGIRPLDQTLVKAVTSMIPPARARP
jgi:hypothetical protein